MLHVSFKITSEYNNYLVILIEHNISFHQLLITDVNDHLPVFNLSRYIIDITKRKMLKCVRCRNEHHNSHRVI